MKPTYRMHSKRLSDYLVRKTAAARQWAKDLGADAAVETATNTLDMMVARELRGEDWMSDAEMRDELYLCTSALLARADVRPHRWYRDFSHYPFMGESPRVWQR